MTVTPPGAVARTSGPSLRIHWGRLGLALLGAISLLGAIVTGILAPLTSAVTFVAPLVFLGLLAASIVALRVLAVLRHGQRRRSRVEQAFSEAMNPLSQQDPSAGTDAATSARAPRGSSAGRGRLGQPVAADAQLEESTADASAAEPSNAGSFNAEPFNALSADERGAGGPASLQTVDVDGIPEGVGETLPETAAPEVGYQVATPGSVSTGGVWEPREVPKPRYLTAGKADRTVPEPLETEPVRASPDVKLRQPAAPPASPSAATPSRAESADPASPSAGTPSSPAEVPFEADRSRRSKPAIDLDEVLKRRRA
ncbi:MAG TPA: hypothetical protein H9871_08800 [Candidatus Nesterenkonia stercoripullorum]|uniref:Uncharacterized protein n=1 Tax=Candidatus Nesterenkonia stercoripullorum TaxID=2838701 RepID=A0A9D1UTS9_9MICC|nr:hypothetical protein [Candidatus Nesterenkonia stercoripullorum]